MKRPFKKKWYEKYLPFVARSPEKQIEWMVAAFNKGALSNEEITPYIRLILSDDSDAHLAEYASLINGLGPEILEKIFQCADIYDVPKLFRIVERPAEKHAVLALRKIPPPHEKETKLVFHRVFQAIYNNSPALLEKAAESIRNSGDVPGHFNASYEMFKEIVEDEKLLSTLYPKARG